ncbi:serine protease, partial [Dinochytrium kinnereticum]
MTRLSFLSLTLTLVLSTLTLADPLPDTVPNSYIVVLAPGASLEVHRKWLDTQIKEKFVPVEGYSEPYMMLLNEAEDGTVGPTLPGYLIAGTTEEFAQLITTHETVDIVQPNRYHYMFGIQEKPGSPSLQAVSGTVNDTYTFADTAGENVDVYVLDTGVNTSHPEFEGRARSGPSFTDNGTTNDTVGHGTHIAGTIASKTYGIAKKSNIISLKVLDSEGRGTTATLLQGLNHAIASARSTRRSSIINLSLGGPKDFVLDLAISQAVIAGIPVVAAAGNDGPSSDACESSPAGASAAFAVGAATVSPVDGSAVWAPFSAGGRCVRAVAPGTFVVSVGSEGEDGVAASGTSMAAPHVAG